MKHGLCHAHRHNDLEGQSNFSSTIYSFCILCLEHHYCGDQPWHSLKSLIRQVPLFTYSGLGVVIFGLGLVSSDLGPWSWSYYFGIGLGLKNLVLFTLLINMVTPDTVSDRV